MHMHEQVDEMRSYWEREQELRQVEAREARNRYDALQESLCEQMTQERAVHRQKIAELYTEVETAQ